MVQWREKVVTEAKKQNIESFTNVILSIIWVESGGDGETVPDIMGIAKAQNLNQTINPEKSIELGVAYFANLIRKAQMYQLGNLAAIQAYNYGEDYLDELIRTDSKYTFEHSKAYAQERSNGEVVSYNKGVALDLGYNWRYAFGDMFYARLISYNLSNSTGKLVEVATKEIGTLNGNKYWEWAGYESRMEWSAIFVTWVAEQAGYLSQGRVPNTVRPLDMFNWYKKNNKFKATDIGYIPQPGDLIFFDWKGNKTGKDQVGIVEFTGGNTIQVIEGNSENMVRRRTYTLDHSAISGYGVP
ncbi:MAG: lysozyme family protein [Enterococcus hirae]|nr:lysozyme family protein [Enterococcus hirae]